MKKKLNLGELRGKQESLKPEPAAEADTYDYEEYDAAARPVNFNPDGTPISGDRVIEIVLNEPAGDVCLLAFSGGKDSAAAWLKLRDHFSRIVPFYMYRIPNLPYVEYSLKKYEDFFGQRILRLPNPDLYHMLRKLAWIPPELCAVVEAADLPDMMYDQLTDMIKEIEGLPPDTFVATGVRAVDNIERGMAVRRHGPINWKRRTFWPVWDMKKADVAAFLTAARIELSVEYEWFGHSLGGMDYRYLSGMKRNSPSDWAEVLRWFPLAWLEIARYETVGNWRHEYGEEKSED